MLSQYRRQVPSNRAQYTPYGQLLPSTPHTACIQNSQGSEGIRNPQKSEGTQSPHSCEGSQEDRVVITLVGAGRGPLILCSLQAAKKTRREVVVYAIEKNPNAIVTLRSLHKSLQWGDQVHIVETDMRVYKPEFYSDIILSELLGSFADNELSPECLVGTQNCLISGGVYIPQNSSSFMACCMSSRIWNNVTPRPPHKV